MHGRPVVVGGSGASRLSSAPRSAPRAIVGPEDVMDLQALAGNRATTTALQREPEAPAAPLPTRMGYVGMNPDAGKEAAKLKKQMGEGVITSLEDPARKKDLSTPEGVTWHIGVDMQIPVNDPKFAALQKVFDESSPSSRDQISDLVDMFAGAERGDYDLDRLVLSGHSDGVKVWGEARADHAGTSLLVERDLGNLAAAFPQAAGEIRHVMFSACYTVAAVNLVVKAFPGLQDVWSYSGSSPDVKGGSAEHIMAWEKDTEGKKGLKKGEQLGTAALWTKDKGFVVGDPKLANFGQSWSHFLAQWDSVVLPQAKGNVAFDKDHLDPVYTDLQHLIADPGINHQQAYEAAEYRDALVRLRYWPKVIAHWATAHAAEIKHVYDLAGIPAPDYSKMSRKEFKEAAKELDKALDAKGNPPDAAKFVKDQIDKVWALKSEVIPEDWV
jgi:hypothetical protein